MYTCKAGKENFRAIYDSIKETSALVMRMPAKYMVVELWRGTDSDVIVTIDSSNEIFSIQVTTENSKFQYV